MIVESSKKIKKIKTSSNSAKIKSLEEKQFLDLIAVIFSKSIINEVKC